MKKTNHLRTVLLTLPIIALAAGLFRLGAASYVSFVSNKTVSVSAGAWIPTTPENVQILAEGQSVCGQSTNQGTLDLSWDAVAPTSQGYDIGYQVRMTNPAGVSEIVFENTVQNSASYQFADNGSHLFEVRSFSDVDGNGLADAGDFTSEWSNNCQVTLDTSAPETVSQLGFVTNTATAENFQTCPAIFNQSAGERHLYWSPSNDQGVGTAGYQLEILRNQQIVFSQNVTSHYLESLSMNGLMSDGEYLVRLAGFDSLNNISATTECSYSIDSQIPQSNITVGGWQPQEIIINDAFENQLSNWTTIGEVNLVTGQENGVIPTGNAMVRIGSPISSSNNEGNSVDVNILTQKLDLSNDRAKTVSFDYNFTTYEDGVGFDEPGFMVYVGDQMVYRLWASDVVTDEDASTLDSTGWKTITLDLSRYSDSEITLALYSGNTGDLTKQSFVYLDNFSTSEVIANGKTTFEISATDNNPNATVFYEYTAGGQEFTGNFVNSGVLSLVAQPDDNTLRYWAVDAAQNLESTKALTVRFDNSNPDSITDLQLDDSGEGLFDLSWTAPADGSGQLSRYELKYSTAPIVTTISEQDWQQLATPTILNTDGLPGGGLRSPLTAGQIENARVKVSDGSFTYYFAIRAVDTAGNFSLLEQGSVASAGVITEADQLVQFGDVIINEVMWTGSSQSNADEWIELRNLTSSELDISGWQIANAATGTQSVTLPQGSLIPANGFFIISNYQSDNSNTLLKNTVEYATSAISLDNNGEQLILRTSLGLAVDSTPVGAWPAGLIDSLTGEYRSMERNLDPGIATFNDGSDSSNWHTCDSQSCDSAQSTYFKVATQSFGTPGGDNLSFTTEQLQPTFIHSLDAATAELSVTLDKVNQFTDAEFEIVYNYSENEQQVQYGLSDNVNFPINTRTFTKQFKFESCSTNRQDCTIHSNSEIALIKIIFTNQSGEQKILSWSPENTLQGE